MASTRPRRASAKSSVGVKAPKPLWVCPDCDRQFVSVNKYHSCGLYPLDVHFQGKDPATRTLFDAFVKSLKKFGPVRVFPVKTRIILEAQTQFAAIVPRLHWLECQFWLQRRAAHPLIRRIEMQVFRDYGHIFRLTSLVELDQDLLDLLSEAYVLASSRNVAS